MSGLPGQALPAADANSDGKTDLADLAVVVAHWQASGTAARGGADVNLDGAVDLNDIRVILSHWQTSAAPERP